MAYRIDRRTVSIDEARAILAVHGEPIARTERVVLEAAAGRVLARDVYAAADIPPFARAVMDGYAVVASDTTGASRDAPVRLTLIESIFSGAVPTETLGPGMCAGFAAGGTAHHLLNRTDADVAYLEMGDRTPGDEATYPDDDLQAVAIGPGKWAFTRKDGTPY